MSSMTPDRFYQAVSNALGDALAVESVLFNAILSFLPMRNASDLPKSIIAVSLAVSSSHQSVLERERPSNQAFWRRLVLVVFDFEVNVSMSFNVEECAGYPPVDIRRKYHGPSRYVIVDETGYSPSDCYEGDAEFRAVVDEWRQMYGNSSVEVHLREDLAYWEHLGIYFRPSQYGFLRAIQQGEMTMEDWPAHEDACTLFSDLSTLTDEFKQFDDVWTYSDGDQPVFPCLLRTLQRPLGPRNFGLLENCGLVPLFWANVRNPVGQWERFGGNMADIAAIFPLSKREDTARSELQDLVMQRLTDWRVAAVTHGETVGPIFYLGTSKRSQRWLGFVGQAEYWWHEVLP